MNNFTKSAVGSLIISVIVVAVGLAAYHPSSQTVVEPQVVKGTDPEISSPYLTVNGITEWYQAKQFTTTAGSSTGQTMSTTTLCSFASPFATSTQSASTTPQFIGLRLSQASTSAIEIDVATSSGPAATSGTPFIKNFIAGANATSSGIFWLNPGGSNQIYQNNFEYINVVAGGGASSNYPDIAGTCYLESTQY